ncbi:Uncharacterized protein HZ326_10417 [Fusarium oxysporum f. sp. albedinis]|nr:Uncharacterized protein HZ326_10417 [Fusarium oxysporum f. sp. albedinis]
MAHIVAAHSSRPLSFVCHFDKVASFLQITALPWKRKTKPQVGKQDVIVPPSLFLFASTIYLTALHLMSPIRVSYEVSQLRLRAIVT